MTEDNTKHTPGPWVVMTLDDEIWVNGIAKGATRVVADMVLTQSADDRMANARLIAAAPERAKIADEMLTELKDIAATADELLAALEYALPLVERWCHTQGDAQAFHEETVAPINAAIAKAKMIKLKEAK